ncbi:polyketide synthase dehydratase domain-containing protein [Streptomyces sp. M19]
MWAEAELPEPQWIQAAAFGIHPALLDAVLHAAVFAGPAAGSAAAGPAEGEDDSEAARLPFMFGDVVLRASGATRVRLCLTRIGQDEFSVAVADNTGAPVLSIGALSTRPLPDNALVSATHDTVVLAPAWIGMDAVGPQGTSADARVETPQTDGWAVVGQACARLRVTPIWTP